jgi:putative DNA primase/helicase
MNAATIANALGGRRSGRGWICRCPVHGDDTPSLSLADGDRRVVLYCHAGCSYFDVVKTLRKAGLWERWRRSAITSSAVEQPLPSEPRRDPLQTWRDGYNIRDTPAEAYLYRRGLQLTDGEAEALRFHDSLWHWPTQTGRPAMLALVKLASGVELTVHQTFLAPGGVNKAAVEKPRLFPSGVSPAGGGVWFGVADPLSEFVVAEGVETAISALRLLNAKAGCAALSELGIRKLILPPEARRVRRGSWDVTIVDRRPYRSSRISSRS